MLVKEIMTASPACCTAETKLQDVAKMMVDHDCGCIPVVEDTSTNVPVGVVTDRDICCRIVAEGRDPSKLAASDAMTAAVKTVTPDMSVADCCKLMEDAQIRRVLVVDKDGGCCGIVAQADIATHADGHKTAEVVQEVSKSVSA